MTKAQKENWGPKELEKQRNDLAKQSEDQQWKVGNHKWKEVGCRRLEVWLKNLTKPKNEGISRRRWKLGGRSNLNPKMKGIRRKMKAWEKAQEPKDEEFEKRMERVEEKFQP